MRVLARILVLQSVLKMLVTAYFTFLLPLGSTANDQDNPRRESLPKQLIFTYSAPRILRLRNEYLNGARWKIYSHNAELFANLISLSIHIYFCLKLAERFS